MRKVLLLMPLLGLLLLVPCSAQAQGTSCSCSAPNSTCQCSVSDCPTGAACICSNRACTCCCIENCPLPELSVLNAEFVEVPASLVASMLSNATDRRIEVTSDGDQLVSLTLTNSTLVPALRKLQREYPNLELTVDGSPFRTIPYDPAELLSVQVQDLPLSGLLDLLSLVSGADVVASGNFDKRISLNSVGTTLPQLIRALEPIAGTKISLEVR